MREGGGGREEEQEVRRESEGLGRRVREGRGEGRGDKAVA